MALTPISKKQSTTIANNIVKCIKTNNMDHLTSAAYKFISICGGFIAHYNLQGFKDYYSNNIMGFYNDILDNKTNCWTNYRDTDKDYAYYKSKSDTYQLICDKLEELSDF